MSQKGIATSAIKGKTQPLMPIVPEADPEDESDYRRTSMRTTQQPPPDQQVEAAPAEAAVDHESVYDVNLEEELMLQDLFFENQVFKFLYFQNDEFTKRIPFNQL